jgi:hypothetical protein
MISKEESLKRSEEISAERDATIDINLPIDIFVTELYRKNSQSFGLGMGRKIIHDSNGALISSDPDHGDAYSTNTSDPLFHEAKSSCSGIKGIYNIVHIRPYQNFDYFILCFVDRKDKFKQQYFLIPKSFICDNFKLSNMNNTRKSNKKNKEIDKRMSIKTEVAHYYFGNANLLADTSYDTLQHYLQSTDENKSMYSNPNPNLNFKSLRSERRAFVRSMKINDSVIEKSKEIIFTLTETIKLLSEDDYDFKAFNTFRRKYMKAKGWVDSLENKKPGKKIIQDALYKQYEAAYKKAHMWKSKIKKPQI